jgi:hypothetical protein
LGGFLSSFGGLFPKKKRRAEHVCPQEERRAETVTKNGFLAMVSQSEHHFNVQISPGNYQLSMLDEVDNK